MKINGYELPKSAFLSVDKDMGQLVDLFLRNDRLKKMLHYTTKDCLSRPALTEEETIELMGKNIKNVPKLYVDGSVLNYIIINFDNFTKSGNPEFRDCMVEFDIICHFDQWQMQDFNLRPYRIAAEIDGMVNEKRFSGLGKLEFVGASQMVLTDEYAGLCLMYTAVHGTDDEQDAPNKKDNEDIIENFNKIFNQ